MTIRPMLACQYDPKWLQFPLSVQPKYDGIRAMYDEGQAMSRNWKLIPNQFVQSQLRIAHLNSPRLSGLQCLDGELIVGDPVAEGCYRATDSGVMSVHGEPDFRYYVFDFYTDSRELTYVDRRAYVDDILVATCSDHLVLVPEKIVYDESQLLEEEARLVAEGHEGAILRKMSGLYKYGRSTPREFYLVKFKRFEDAEAVIVGFEELYSNQNPKTQDAFGLTERSSHAANMVPMDTLGAFVAQRVDENKNPYGDTFRVGSFKGLNLEQRRAIWQSRGAFLGRVFTYKSQKVGGYDKPRFPIWKGWRSDL